MTRLVGPELTHSAARRCKSNTTFASAVLGLSGKRQQDQIVQKRLRGTLALQHGALALMAGSFQRDFQHCTIPANMWENCWAKGSPAQKRCRREPTADYPRLNLTGRFVMQHHPNCPVRCRASPLVDIPSADPASSVEAPIEAPGSDAGRAAEEIQRLQDEEIQRLRAEVTASKAREAESLERVRTYEAELMAKEEELANIAASALAAAQAAFDHEQQARQLAAARASKLRAEAHTAAVELSLNLAQRLEQLMRFAFFESCGDADQLFRKGGLEIPLGVCKAVPNEAGVVPPLPFPPGGPRQIQGSAGNFASGEFFEGWSSG